MPKIVRYFGKIVRFDFRVLFGGIGVFGLVLGSLVGAAPTEAKSSNLFHFNSFVADYYLSQAEDGTSRMHVREILTTNFEEPRQNHGIMRIIPRTNQGGANKIVDGKGSLNLTVTRNGMPEQVSQIEEQEDNYLIYIGNPEEYVEGTQVYTIEYDFSDVIAEYATDGGNVSGLTETKEAWQELAWDTGLDDWHQSFDEVVVNLHLPENERSNLLEEVSCEVGVSNAKEAGRCEVRETEDGVALTAQDFTTDETLDFTVRFNPGTFVVALGENYLLVVLFGIEIVVGGAVLLYSWRRWRRTARRSQLMYRSLPKVPRFKLPKGITVAEGALVAQGRTGSSYVATLLEMAVAGKIAVQNLGEDVWSVIILEDLDNLSGPERETLRILANRRQLGRGLEIPIERHTADRSLAGHAMRYQEEARAALVKNGYLEPERVRRKLSPLMVVMICVVVWVLLAVVAMVGPEVWDRIQPSGNAILVGGAGLAWVNGILLVLIVGATGWFWWGIKRFGMYTDKGVELAIYLEGMRQFMLMSSRERVKLVKSTRKADATPEGLVKIAEDLLPWASLFGLEENWVRGIEKYYQPTMGKKLDEVTRAMEPSRELLNGLALANMAAKINGAMRQSTYYAGKKDK